MLNISLAADFDYIKWIAHYSWVILAFVSYSYLTEKSMCRRTVISGGLNIPAPTAVAVFENEAFWTDLTKQGVMRVNMYQGVSSLQQIYQNQSAIPVSIKVIHTSKQNRISQGM